MSNHIFSEYQLGQITLNNRIAMAPMTRSRSVEEDVITPLAKEYYGQRASAGLIITEGSPISKVGRGYSFTPGIYTQEQIDGWKAVTDEVHKKGGKIFIQLWHVGRRSHSNISGTQPVAPSAIKEADKVWGPLGDGTYGMIETESPKEMSLEEIKQTQNDFVQAAKNAMEVGFDGVELHGAHGYLLDSFLRAHSNQRTDEYGGSIENRMRMTIETVEAVAYAIGADKTAIRISPFVAEGSVNHDPEMIDLSLALVKALDQFGLAYLHFSENISNYKEVTEAYRKEIRSIYHHPIMVAGKLTQEIAEDLLAKGLVDLVAFGQPFITNPDLVERMKNNWPLTPVDYANHNTFYGGGAEGYIDYATYQK
ncbi:alkene reductase [Flammeovirga yaeyamensis]|uniref:Alkene reductase n=1 Tax=Flammeovirga yaeyamensis TaxID=367791 RepID=A0AAX1N547_9BACT|nr:alkene reductase [Flammeovirga yaeyamensis]MBB3701301.1 N-ethylmaleimide reductase [Flammeovirga yaeyamensis]NMF38230.1 alkene reductase [Flammeovirga yaeyamensis]QWG02641.1 alkene reductase [Flammeovirga yaeyamensis]